MGEDKKENTDMAEFEGDSAPSPQQPKPVRRIDRQALTLRQEKYVALRMQGLPPNQAKNAAGYAKTQPATELERGYINRNGVMVESKSARALRVALAKQELTNDFLAKELKKSILGCDKAITKFGREGQEVTDPDYSSKAKLLSILTKLQGHDQKPEPLPPQSVTQIYNDNRNGTNATEFADGEANSIINFLREELGRRQIGNILPCNTEPPDPLAR